MGNDDYGYFGTGSTGYAHYTQAHSRSFSSSKPTSSGGKYTTSNGDVDDPIKELCNRFFIALMILGVIYVVGSIFIIALETSSYLQGWTTLAEFNNNASGWIVTFIIALPCAICGFRHVFR